MVAKALACISVTVGEPAGIGADILLTLIQRPQVIIPVVFADFRLLKARAQLLNLPLTLHEWQGQQEVLPLGELYGVDIPQAGGFLPGELDVNNVAQVLASLTAATNACLRGDMTALITGPVHKAIINDAGITFSGQTEWIAKLCEVNVPVMMLASETLRVALVTTHVPLSQVPALITERRLTQVITATVNDLTRFFGIAKPKLAICGLNPHAGEQGHLGKEEEDIINPCLAKLRAKGFNVSDTLPADTLFVPSFARQYDVIIAMYHDQGLPVVKAQGFGSVVNMTLGLPICRLSVDHGTALSLAGTGQAKDDSLQTAFDLAAKLSQH